MTDLLTTIDAGGTARVALNRPAKHNAFDAALIASLCDTFRRLAVDSAVRAIVLSGEGPSFSAGADANWMRASASLSEAENRADALRLSDMLKAVNDCPKPVIAVAHGFVFGGGVGLVACADMAVARTGTRFKLSEVRLGLTPATISPFVVARIGPAARRWFLTAEEFGPAEALAMGLVDVVADDPHEQVAMWLDEIHQGAPGAIADAKALIRDVSARPITDELRALTADRIAARRSSAEGREGLAAFIDRRKPDWSL